MKKWILLVLLLCLVTGAALADGYGASDYESGDGLGPALGYATVCSRSVTIRSQPSYSGSNLQSASNGDMLTVLSQNGNWVQVRYEKNGRTYEGWVIGSYIVMQPLTVTLRASNIPAYCAPDRTSKLVGSLARGTTLTVLGTWGNYYIVNLREASAFISMNAELVTSLELYDQVAHSSTTARVRARTKMRTGPGTEYGDAGTAQAGALVWVGDFEDGWVLISCDGALGYVPESSLDIYYDDGEING